MGDGLGTFAPTSGGAAFQVATAPTSGQAQAGGCPEKPGRQGPEAPPPQVIRTFAQQRRPRGGGLLRLHGVVVVVAGPGRRVLAGRFLRKGLTPRGGLQGALFLVWSCSLVHRRDFNACLDNQ